MKQRLGNFELVEQIDPGGFTVVWRAVEHMGHGVSRPAAVKVLQHWRSSADEQIDTLRSEVELLLAVGSCPYIVQVFGFGLDEEVGPWIGMELSGKNLKHFMSESPANPHDVRQMVHDTLKALSVVHGSDPQILHRDIKPNNILRSKYGHWQIADFGLAKRAGVEDTMNFTTVQYAAPELLDSSIGQESPKMDLYSLGMIAYEYALGRELYRKQFPSIYDPYATRSDSTSMDERPKWMYWHTSQQMMLPKLHELIPGFPEDLSELISAMITKPLRERLASADEGLRRIGEVAPRQLGGDGDLEEIESKPATASPLAIGAILLWIIAAVGGIGYFLWQKANVNPQIELASSVFTSEKPEILVRGTITGFPAGGKASITLRDSPPFPINVDDSGEFSGVVSVGSVSEDEQIAQMRIDYNGKRWEKSVSLKRLAPKTVKVTFRTTPSVELTDLKVRPNATPNDPIALITDKSGTAAFDIPHGGFKVELEHARYKAYENTFETGDDPTKVLNISLIGLSEQVIASKRERLLSEMDKLVDLAAKGDPDAIKRLEQIRKELNQLEPVSGDNDAAKRVALLQELDEMSKRAAAGDLEAAKRVKEINAELRKLAMGAKDRDLTGGPAEPSAQAARQARRAQLLSEMNDLLDKAANGDPDAIKRLAEIQKELAALEGEDMKSGGGNDRRAALIREMAALADRAAAGDPAAIQRLREIRSELQQINDDEDAKRSGKPVTSLFEKRELLLRQLGDAIGLSNAGDNTAYPTMRNIYTELMTLEKADMSSGAIPKRRKELLAELQTTIELAAVGNADAKLRLPDIHRELATLSAIEASGGDSSKLALAASRMMVGDPGLDLIDRGTLLGLTSEQFKAFLELNVPNGALKVELVPHLTKVRLTGPVFNQDEYDRLMNRLAPALARLQLEVRIDAWAVCRRLEDALGKLGAESVRVHAHLSVGDNAMFVQFKKNDRFTKDQVFVLARPYVIDRDMLRLQSL